MGVYIKERGARVCPNGISVDALSLPDLECWVESPHRVLGGEIQSVLGQFNPEDSKNGYPLTANILIRISSSTSRFHPANECRASAPGHCERITVCT